MVWFDGHQQEVNNPTQVQHSYCYKIFQWVKRVNWLKGDNGHNNLPKGSQGSNEE
jgi:hypothetical protein